MIMLGVSGWSYDDWIGPVYPEDLPRYRWLSYIAEQVDTVEVNVTYYRLPAAKMVQGWVERTPDDFVFSAKAHRSITHERTAPDFEAYAESVQPLTEAGKLACVLAQFPYSFHATDENRDYLLRLRDGLAELPVVIEFRNRAWVTDETFELLDELRFGYCSVDEPRLDNLMPPIARATGPLAYVRFHGRNADTWWDHDEAWQRYDYTYSSEELGEWVPKLQSLDAAVPMTLGYANNHYRGQSLAAVRELRKLLSTQ